MGLITDKDKETIKKEFGNLKANVKMLVFTTDDGCEHCKIILEIAKEVQTLSEKIKVESYDIGRNKDVAEKYGIDKTPALVLESGGRRAVFYGIPAGYEFTTLIEDIIEISNEKPELYERTRDMLRQVDKDVHIMVFVTPTCPYCPAAVRVAHKFAFENSKIRAEMIEASEFPELAEKHGVFSVPKVVINNEVEFEGALPEEQFAEHVLLAIGKNI
ncbi:MAG: thioredoxin family protein [Thermoplasmata archaeon]|nr:thioredoxin family protein [Thermoplasmata archaeon]